MNLQDLGPGWRSEFILHEHGAVVVERSDCIVVRTPAQPTFYWGNCLLLPQAPADDDLTHWERRHHDEIGAPQSASLHRAFGINAAPAGESLPSWQRSGYELIRTAVLQQRPGDLRPPARPARGVIHMRPFDLAAELELVVALQTVDNEGYEPAGYEAHRRGQMQRCAAMAACGRAQWFGLWCDGVPAADCGLIRSRAAPGALGRFQHVSTQPAWRRRGLCTALIHAVTAWGFEHWQLDRVLMCADPDDVAIGIYQSLGYSRIADDWGLQRRAPQDRLPVPA